MKISVVMCTYNGEKYIKEQLDSILNQTYKADEIIVCDDNSGDRTVEIANSILSGVSVDYRIVVNEIQKGVADNFFNGLKLAIGDYVFTCDQDDIWFPDKIETFVCEIEKSQKLLYFSNGAIADSNGKAIGIDLWKTLTFETGMLKKNTYFELLINRCLVTGAAMAVSKELITMIDYVPEGWLHDGWFAIRAALMNSLQAIDKETFLYRQHGNNVIGAGKTSFWGKVCTWLENIKVMENVRRDRYLRYKAVLPVCDKELLPKLNECVGFWSDMDSISKVTRIKAVYIVLRNFVKGNYKKYYAGSRAALRDMISIII